MGIAEDRGGRLAWRWRSAAASLGRTHFITEAAVFTKQENVLYKSGAL
jgi:hypothetical protein